MIDLLFQVSPDPINSISGGMLSSPHLVEDLFPKCTIQRATDLLDWMGGAPEEYLTCDLATNTIQMSTGTVTPNIISNPLTDDASYSDFTGDSSPDPSRDKSWQDSVSVDSLRFDDLKPNDLPAPPIQQCDSCPESDRKLASLDFDEPDPTSTNDRMPVEPQAVPPVRDTVKITSKTNTDSSVPDNAAVLTNDSGSLLDFEDKYSALRSLEQRENPNSDDFGDFITAEPLSCLEVSPPPVMPQANIKVRMYVYVYLN